MRRFTLILPALLLCASPAAAQTEEALLDTLQHTAFNFFWNEANATNGLIRDRSQSGSPCSIASLGFGLTGICIGIDHGWVTRAAGAERVRRALLTLWSKPQSTDSVNAIGYKGFFYHFLDMNTALRMPGWKPELSSIDTGLLLAGILDTRQYFNGLDTTETRIRDYADSIYRRVDWVWMKNSGAGLSHGWRPDGMSPGFISFRWIGYSEAMILYILALGSPTYPIPASDWNVWTSGYSWQTHYGFSYVNFPPLFGHQYSHCWIDFRSIADAYMRGRGITYWENSRRATLAQRAYAIANPLGRVGYRDSLWGLTASDTPTGYNARGAPPAQNDDGTITPTAPLSSIPFANDEGMAVAWYLWNHYRTGPLWGPYGFRDAFNLQVNPDWYDPDYIGIDEGPFLIMIENYRTGRVWSRMRANADIQRGLQLADFQVVANAVPDPRLGPDVLLSAVPNPFAETTTLRFRLAADAAVRVTMHDVAGREVARLADGMRSAGTHTVSFPGRGLPAGIYHARLESNGRVWTRRCVLVR